MAARCCHGRSALGHRGEEVGLRVADPRLALHKSARLRSSLGGLGTRRQGGVLREGPARRIPATTNERGSFLAYPELVGLRCDTNGRDTSSAYVQVVSNPALGDRMAAGQTPGKRRRDLGLGPNVALPIVPAVQARQVSCRLPDCLGRTSSGAAGQQALRCRQPCRLSAGWPRVTRGRLL